MLQLLLIDSNPVPCNMDEFMIRMSTTFVSCVYEAVVLTLKKDKAYRYWIGRRGTERKKEADKTEYDDKKNTRKLMYLCIFGCFWSLCYFSPLYKSCMLTVLYFKLVLL